VDLHIYLHVDVENTQTNQQLSAIQQRLNQLIQGETKIMATLDDVVAATAAEKTVVDSAVALLNNLTAMLQAALATGDPTKIQAAVDAITAQTQELATAVAANTPAAPAPTP
jgi:uncharacterized protein (DUF2336 family)